MGEAMIEIPSSLIATLPTGAETVARGWWDSLTDADRQQLIDMWDERLEVKFFSPQCSDAGDTDDWERVPKVRGSRFVPTDDTRGLEEWGPGYFEHLLQHPELVIVWEPEQRTFHIGCTSHPAARECMKSGQVPVDFRCPLDSLACPLLPLRGSRRTN
jgi:hypothetical protein